MVEFAGFKNDFAGVFAAFALDDVEKTPAGIRIAGKKVAVGKNGVDFVGTAAQAFFDFVFHQLEIVAAGGEIDHGGNFDRRFLQQFAGQRHPFRINADGGRRSVGRDRLGAQGGDFFFRIVMAERGEVQTADQAESVLDVTHGRTP